MLSRALVSSLIAKPCFLYPCEFSYFADRSGKAGQQRRSPFLSFSQKQLPLRFPRWVFPLSFVFPHFS